MEEVAWQSGDIVRLHHVSTDHAVDTGHQEVVPLPLAQTLLAQHHAQLGRRHGRVVSAGAGGRRHHPASRDQGTWAAAVELSTQRTFANFSSARRRPLQGPSHC